MRYVMPASPTPIEEGERVQVGVPEQGTGEGFPSLHGPPKGGAMPTDMKKAAVLAACPPCFRDANLASLMCSDNTSIGHAPAVRQGLAESTQAGRSASRQYIGRHCATETPLSAAATGCRQHCAVQRKHCMCHRQAVPYERQSVQGVARFMLSLAFGIVRRNFYQPFDSSPLDQTLPKPCYNLGSLGSTFISLYDSGFCFFGLPPFRPLMRDCSLPASVFGPVLKPPCHLQRPLS